MRSNMIEPNHYEVLAVADSAPLNVIKAAHRAQMREHHPDAVAGDDIMAKRLNEALRVLRDPDLRAAYDARITLLAESIRAEAARAEAAAAARRDAEILARGQRAAAEAAQRAEAAERAKAQAQAKAQAEASGSGFEGKDPPWLAEFDVYKRNDIKVSSMDWWNRDYPPLQIRHAPSRAPRMLRKLAWLLLVINSVLALVPVVRNFESSPGIVLLMALLIPGAALLGGWARAHARRGLVRYLLYLAYAGWFLMPLLTEGPYPRFLPYVWLGSYVVMIEVFRATAGSPRRVRSDRLLDPEDIAEHACWESTPYTEVPETVAALPPAKIAERLTGQLLGALDHLPGSRTVQGLVFPEYPDRRVGHAVLCGSRLALIDSRYCPGGTYYWAHGSLLQDLPGQRPREISYHFPTAVENYRRLFPDLEVRGWTVFHAMDQTPMVTNNAAGDDRPRLTTPSMLLREAGDWLASGDPSLVDRVVFSRLLHDFGQP